MKNNIEGETKKPPKPENTTPDKKAESKVELNPPRIKDIDSYNIRIEGANKNIDAWERLRDKASSVGNKLEAEKRQTMIDTERAAIKVMEDKLEKAETLKKEAPGKVERKGKGKSKEASFEWFKKDSIAGEDRKRIEAMMVENYKSRGVTREQIDDIRKKTPTRWENEVRSLLETEQKGKRETIGGKKGAYEKLMEDKNKMYDKAVEGQKQKEAVDREKRIENLLAQMRVIKEALDEKHVNKFEEFEESIKRVAGEKPSYEVLKDAYLRNLGWKVEYNYLHTKAWLIDNATGKFVTESGELTDKKKDRKEFPTQSGFSVETPFFKFLKEQAQRKLGETPYSPEEEILAKREAYKKEEYSPEELELADRLAKEKEVKEAEYSPEEEMADREAIEPKEEYAQKKKKKPSLWKRFTQNIRRLFSRERNF
ncbi:MAG TPA: hypothetical protein VJ378_02095 [Candidatus Paceibacterota bacterium]|nr:hypothetical protein [Candidatus Paceibacterota bacterium]